MDDDRAQLEQEASDIERHIAECEHEISVYRERLWRVYNKINRLDTAPPSPPPSTSAINEPPRDGVGG